ncbi:hypothetical protein ACOSZF_19895 [Cytobacillus firmus]|uniref:hypothetical protein n=1 Tax=Cytobacillus firmus TaxID=1399 RepID=UPI003BA368B8
MTAKLTQEEYEHRIHGLGVAVLEEYQGLKKPILHLCKCGREWVSSPGNVLNGQKCKECKRKQMKLRFSKSRGLYETELKPLGIKLLGDYINSRTKTDHICVCGRKFNARPHRVLQGDKCGICTKNKDKLITHRDYLNQLAAREIKVAPIDIYVNMRTKIKHRCVCGNEWDSSPINVLNGWLCGCERSRGEIEIREWLISRGVKFKQEYSFPDLKYKRLLRYDFALFSKEGLFCLIEFQGKQHFKQVGTWHRSKQDFTESQNRDALKREYAERNGIPLIEMMS